MPYIEKNATAIKRKRPPESLTDTMDSKGQRSKLPVGLSRRYEHVTDDTASSRPSITFATDVSAGTGQIETEITPALQSFTHARYGRITASERSEPITVLMPGLRYDPPVSSQQSYHQIRVAYNNKGEQFMIPLERDAVALTQSGNPLTKKNALKMRPVVENDKILLNTEGKPLTHNTLQAARKRKKTYAEQKGPQHLKAKRASFYSAASNPIVPPPGGLVSGGSEAPQQEQNPAEAVGSSKPDISFDIYGGIVENDNIFEYRSSDDNE